MTLMQEALMRAGAVTDEDVARVDRQRRIAAEKERKRQLGIRWGWAFARLPDWAHDMIAEARKREPDSISLVTVEGWAELPPGALEEAFVRAYVARLAVSLGSSESESHDGPSDR